MATLTVYPVAGAVSPCDGHIRNTAQATWASARDATVGTVADVTDTTGYLGEASLAGTYAVSRVFMNFDTSALGAGAVISAAVLSLAGTGDANQNADTTNVHIVSATPAGTNDIVVADFDQVGSTSFASMNLADWNSTNGVYNNFTLNASGIAYINKTGITTLGARVGRDLDNSSPTGTNRVLCRTADNVGTTSDPKLVITYTTASSIKQTLILLLGVQ